MTFSPLLDEGLSSSQSPSVSFPYKKFFGHLAIIIAVVSTVALLILLCAPASALTLAFGAGFVAALSGKMGMSLILLGAIVLSAVAAAILLAKKPKNTASDDQENCSLRVKKFPISRINLKEI